MKHSVELSITDQINGNRPFTLMLNKSSTSRVIEITNGPTSYAAGMDTMETVIAAAIGLLAAVFLGALFVLVILCKRHHRGHESYIKKIVGGKRHYQDSDILISENRPPHLLTAPRSSLELVEVVLHPDIENILEDKQWINDATGLVPHALAVLKACHTLMERFAELALSKYSCGRDVVEVARRISPRVDDVVRSMYPPLNPLLMEARTAALALAVTQLAMLVTARHRAPPAWITAELAEIDTHLLVLREAALTQEAGFRMQNVINETGNTINCEDKTEGSH